MNDAMAKDLENRSLSHLWGAGLNGDWQPFLELLCDGLRSRCATLVDHDHAMGSGRLLAAVGVDAKMQDLYDAHYNRVNVWLPRQARLPEGSVVASEQLLPLRELQRSEYFTDWLRPQGLAHAIGSTVIRQGEEVAKLGVLRGRAEGSYSETELCLARRLMPHLAGALKVARRLRALEAEQFHADQGFDLNPVGLMLVNRQLWVARSNPAADRILALRDGLGVDIRGHLRMHDSVAQQALAGWLADCVELGVQALACRRLQVPRPSRRPSFLLQLAPAPDCASAAALARDLRRGAQMLLMVIDPARSLAPDEACAQEWLAWQFGLSRAEARLACRLGEGQSLAEAAAVLGISEGNARTTSKQVLRKCGVSRQSELVRLMLNSRMC